MKVLIACEFSQIVTKAFRAKGHEAFSCDILPTEGDPAWHIQGDAVMVAYTEHWDMMIAHDPCTYQCNSGVRWLYNKDGSRNMERWLELERSCRFTKKLLDAPIEKICRENPIPHKYAVKLIGRTYDQIIQPWQFGHGETKATCLWLKNLRKLGTTKLVAGREARIYRMSPGEDRGKLRSITLPGIADGFAEQWG